MSPTSTWVLFAALDTPFAPSSMALAIVPMALAISSIVRLRLSVFSANSPITPSM